MWKSFGFESLVADVGRVVLPFAKTFSLLSNQLAKNFYLKAYSSFLTWHQERRHQSKRFDQQSPKLFRNSFVDLKETEETNNSFDVHKNVQLTRRTCSDFFLSQKC